LKTIDLFILTANIFGSRDERLMLETSEERVRLLKNGIKSKTIEELYIRHNKIKIIQSPILFNFVETSSGNGMDSTDNTIIELKQPCQRRDNAMFKSLLEQT
jgi:hypothetical protein